MKQDQESKRCPQNDDYSCKDRAQCHEPCGDLGHKKLYEKKSPTLLLIKDKVK